MNEQQKKTIKQLTSGRLNDDEFAVLIRFIEDVLLAPLKQQSDVKKLTSLTGKVLRKNAEAIVIFKVGSKLYPANDINCDLMDAYLQTGDSIYLTELEDEMRY